MTTLEAGLRKTISLESTEDGLKVYESESALVSMNSQEATGPTLWETKNERGIHSALIVRESEEE